MTSHLWVLLQRACRGSAKPCSVVVATLIGVTILTFCSGCQSRAEQSKFEYVNDLGTAFDEGRILDIPWGDDAAILTVLRAFADRECRSRGLARLVVAPTEEDLVRSINSSTPEPTYPLIRHLALTYPSVFGQDVTELRSSQVLCLGENATAIIRDGSAVRITQLKGDHNAREVLLNTLSVTVQGFHIYGSEPGDARATIFVRMDSMPTPEAAADLRRQLSSVTGVATTLMVRTDPFFWYADGPGFDPFQIPIPRVSGDEFLRRPYIFCIASAMAACEVRVIQ